MKARKSREGNLMKDMVAVPNSELFPYLLELTEQGKPAGFVVAGMSMWPLLRHQRDFVFIEKLEVKDIRKGDIVLLQTPDGKYLLHRVMKKTKTDVVTAGDNKFHYDGTFPVSCVKAKVVIIERGRHKIHCNRFYWRVLFGIWRVLFPIRSQIYAAMRRLKGVGKKTE